MKTYSLATVFIVFACLKCYTADYEYSYDSSETEPNWNDEDEEFDIPPDILKHFLNPQTDSVASNTNDELIFSLKPPSDKYKPALIEKQHALNQRYSPIIYDRPGFSEGFNNDLPYYQDNEAGLHQGDDGIYYNPRPKDQWPQSPQLSDSKSPYYQDNEAGLHQGDDGIYYNPRPKDQWPQSPQLSDSKSPYYQDNEAGLHQGDDGIYYNPRPKDQWPQSPQLSDSKSPYYQDNEAGLHQGDDGIYYNPRPKDQWPQSARLSDPVRYKTDDSIERSEEATLKGTTLRQAGSYEYKSKPLSQVPNKVNDEVPTRFIYHNMTRPWGAI